MAHVVRRQDYSARLRQILQADGPQSAMGAKVESLNRPANELVEPRAVARHVRQYTELQGAAGGPAANLFLYGTRLHRSLRLFLQAMARRRSLLSRGTEAEGVSRLLLRTL